MYLLLVVFSLFFLKTYAEPIQLKVFEKEITVNGKKANILTINPLTLDKGSKFDIILKNELSVPTSIHWHGLILPNTQDGVAFITQFPIYPKTEYHYEFPLIQAGTYFMHSHFGLQEQRLLAAPLILKDAEDAQIANQEIVVMLSDFSFKSPEEIYQRLRTKNLCSEEMKKGKDIVEVDYDAFLANFRTLENPEVVEVKPNSKVRVRLINASSATNYFIHLNLEAEAIAVDGNRIKPLKGKQFELGVAQRIDLLFQIPEKGGFFPIFAQAEGTNKQTGIIMLMPGFQTPTFSSTTSEKAGALTNQQEKKLQALYPLIPKPIGQSVELKLGGDMKNYIWTINNQVWPYVTPVVVKKGERVEIRFTNESTMTHPMHFHGHVFQVTAIDGVKINGAMRDTILVMPHSSVTIQFDADNPGVWPLHCHVLYHLEAGMLTVVRYEDFIQPL